MFSFLDDHPSAVNPKASDYIVDPLLSKNFQKFNGYVQLVELRDEPWMQYPPTL